MSKDNFEFSYVIGSYSLNVTRMKNIHRYINIEMQYLFNYYDENGAFYEDEYLIPFEICNSDDFKNQDKVREGLFIENNYYCLRSENITFLNSYIQAESTYMFFVVEYCN